MSYTPTSFPALSTTSLNQGMEQCVAPPKYPTYLKETLYDKIVQEQYHYFLNRSRTERKQHLDELDLRLPSFWNTKDCSEYIDISENKLGLVYKGPGKLDDHAALVRSNFPAKPQCGIFYFEMKIISKGEEGYIGIGFSIEKNKTNKLPGWDIGSWGYHGDDGFLFEGSGVGKGYGPCYTTGDVIGCGVNFAEQVGFFTKNGKFLGNAVHQLKFDKAIYPSVGLRTVGEKISTNFGQEPFVFDIDGYVKEQKAILNENILAYLKSFESEPALEMKLKSNVDELVLSYLIHHGYTNTAKAVIQDADYVIGHQLSLNQQIKEDDMEIRQKIRSAIVHGRIDEAIQMIDQCFPGILQERKRGQELGFKLKCGKFIEMVRHHCQTHPNPTESRPHRLSYADTLSSPSDEPFGSQVWSRQNSILSPSLDSVVKYGQLLQEEYKNDTQESTRSSLVEIFSLLAYPEPEKSPVAYLLKSNRRDELATEVNAAILAFQHRPEVPALEKIYNQFIVCNEELACEGSGKAILIDIEDYYRKNFI